MRVWSGMFPSRGVFPACDAAEHGQVRPDGIGCSEIPAPGSAPAGGWAARSLPLLSQVGPVLGFKDAGGPREAEFRHVVLIQAFDQVVLSRGQRRLRSHERQVVIDARIYAFGLVAKRLSRQFNI